MPMGQYYVTQSDWDVAAAVLAVRLGNAVQTLVLNPAVGAQYPALAIEDTNTMHFGCFENTDLPHQEDAEMILG